MSLFDFGWLRSVSLTWCMEWETRTLCTTTNTMLMHLLLPNSLNQVHSCLFLIMYLFHIAIALWVLGNVINDILFVWVWINCAILKIRMNKLKRFALCFVFNCLEKNKVYYIYCVIQILLLVLIYFKSDQSITNSFKLRMVIVS
jgi:hypothetical protein